MGGVGTSIYFLPSEDEYPLYLTYRLYFPYTNNIIEYEALILSLYIALNLV